jgi:hypothetical protein
MPPKKGVKKAKKAKKEVRKASCPKDFRKGAVLNTLAMRKKEPPPTLCAGTFLFGCGIKYNQSGCGQCARRIAAMKTSVKNLNRDGATKILAKNAGLFSDIKWLVPPQEALESLFRWKPKLQGPDFFTKKDYSFIMSATIFRANGGRATDTADQYKAYIQAALDFHEEFSNSSIGNMGMFVIFVNKSVNEQTRRRFTDVGIVVHVIDSSICPKEICEDKVSGNMLLRYLALSKKYYGNCGKPIFVFDVDLTFSRQLQAAITNFVFVDHHELPVKVFRSTLDGYYDPKKGANATTMKWTIMGGLFGLRDEALITVSENIERVFDIVSVNKTKPAFVYGDDQTILADHIFPLIKQYRALTIRLTDGNIRTAEPVPAFLNFDSETYFGGRFFHNTEILS